MSFDATPDHEWRAWIDASGVLKFQSPDGHIQRVGRVNGRDGNTPKKGVDYQDGAPGHGITDVSFESADDGMTVVIHLGDKKVRSPLLRRGKDGSTPVKGRDYSDGNDGVGLASIARVGDEIKVALTDGREYAAGIVTDGEDGDDGKMGPVPRHQWGSEIVGRRDTEIRFEMERAPDGSVKLWGQWQDLQGKPGKGRSGSGGGTLLTQQQIINLINQYGGGVTNPLDGYRIADEDSDGTAKYYGYTGESAATWYIMRVDDTGEPATYRYASPSNNASSAAYTDAWLARAGLSYGYLYEISP